MATDLGDDDDDADDDDDDDDDDEWLKCVTPCPAIGYTYTLNLSMHGQTEESGASSSVSPDVSSNRRLNSCGTG